MEKLSIYFVISLLLSSFQVVREPVVYTGMGSIY